MKLGEALTVRARQGQRLNDLRGRINANALVQEGDSPQEDVEGLMVEFAKLSGEHRDHVVRIHRTNAETEIATGTTLLDLLATREMLQRDRGMLHGTAAAATPTTHDLYRYSRSEIKHVTTLNVPELRTRIESLDQDIAALDARIQAVNWETELVE